MEDNACYTISLKGQNSDPNQHRGTLRDPSLSIMKFYDRFDRRFLDPVTRQYTAPPAHEVTDAYYDMIYINPAKFKHTGPVDKVCNQVTPRGDPGNERLICNYYADDNGGQGKQREARHPDLHGSRRGLPDRCR